MERTQWIQDFNAAMLKHFLITLADVGLDDRELDRWRQDYTSNADQAALAFGEHYDLEDVTRRHWG